MKTVVYVDGFNLYYGCLKGTAYKWLDLKNLFKSLLKPQNEIIKIKYFTAKVRATQTDLSAPQRQETYIRALEKHIPEISVHYGHFLQHRQRMANANPPPNTLEVIKTEEKGSDVNLAVQMLNDAWLARYDCAVVVSNDSDMAESMKLIRQYHQNRVLGLITPNRNRTNRTSQQLETVHAHFVRTIRSTNLLSRCQLPATIPGTNIHKPPQW